ncbi:putative PWWP domain-containing protein [Helianthus annuus]|uniref:PWWP domain-containing protein n=1 Tax=Helianthus annuus TaxID=4232 RepID=A0A9K3E3Y6_HELAN|nr:uncharacterized protein LOC110895564 [Helianthus annuus]KAF5765623.1 putative PWWP domain-containing protein [Helianthus annuus]KAJ0474027.1 putative PWWP domain-containing protein [Helianthus annuus]KAJ0832332.1 putative PWWP domain-containing protein [Helianthus annuus]
MGGTTGETNGSLAENKAANVQTSKGVNIGELLWVKLNETSWWPAQIVDENLVSSVNKPSSKGSSSDLLVRLYGSYIYKYVDIHTSSAEFKTMIIKNNFNYHDIVKKSIEQDLPSLRSSKSRKRQQSKSKGKVVTDASQNGSDKSPVSSKKRKQEKPKTAGSHSQTPEIKTKNSKPTLDRVHHDTDPSSPNTATRRPQELSARRVKVMQSLGLVAPLGSPFPRNQVVPANPTVLN